MSTDNGESARKKLGLIKEQTLAQVNYLKSTSDSSVILEKIADVKKSIQDINLDSLDDSIISKFLLMSKLKNEIMEK